MVAISGDVLSLTSFTLLPDKLSLIKFYDSQHHIYHTLGCFSIGQHPMKLLSSTLASFWSEQKNIATTRHQRLGTPRSNGQIALTYSFKRTHTKLSASCDKSTAAQTHAGYK